MLKYFKLLAVLLFVTPVYADGLIVPPSRVGVAPVGQIPGTATNDNANAGNVGQYLSANASSVALTSLTPVTVVSMSVTPGDWDLRCNLSFAGGGSPSTVLQQAASISPTTNTLNTTIGATSYTYLGAAGSGTNIGSSASTQFVGVYRVSVASPTSYYCVARANFTDNAPTVSGVMEARRVR